MTRLTFPCPACAAKRLHTPDDWAHHPYAGHGYNGSCWTHPDLDPVGPQGIGYFHDDIVLECQMVMEEGPQALAGGVSVSQPGEVCLAAPPAGDQINDHADPS